MLDYSMKMIGLLIFLFISVMENGYGAKILFISPSLSNSLLQQTGRMADLLVENGHDVTFWIPEFNQGMRKETGSKKAKIVRMNDIETTVGQSFIDYSNISDGNDSWYNRYRNRAKINRGVEEFCESILKRKRELGSLKRYKFDIAFTDLIDLCSIGLAKYLNINTYIWISTGPLHDDFSYNLGIPTPLSYVQTLEENYGVGPKMNFLDRAKNLFRYLPILYLGLDNTAKLNTMFKKYVSPTFPDLHDLAMQSALCFVNDDEFNEPARPILHKIIYIGGLGIDQPAPIIDPLKSILERGKKGAILVSLGSITSTGNLVYAKKKALFKAFSRFPDYQFIVKVSTDDDISPRLVENISNVKLFYWMPQTDLLGDPHLKLFITHAGANSILESAIRGVPLLTIPLFFDQFRNAYAAAYKGYAYVLEKDDITETNVYNAIQEVLYNPKYKKAAMRISSLYADKPFSPEETMLRWVDFVAKHGNLTELIPEGANLLLFASTLLYVVYRIATLLVTGVFRSSYQKEKGE